MRSTSFFNALLTILAVIGITAGLWLFSWVIMQVLDLTIHGNISLHILIPICAVGLIISLAATIACFEGHCNPVTLVVLFGLLVITSVPIVIFALELISNAVRTAM